MEKIGMQKQRLGAKDRIRYEMDFFLFLISTPLVFANVLLPSSSSLRKPTWKPPLKCPTSTSTKIVISRNSNRIDNNSHIVPTPTFHFSQHTRLAVVLIEMVTRMRNNKKSKTGYMVERYSREPKQPFPLFYVISVWKFSFLLVKDPTKWKRAREREKRGAQQWLYWSWYVVQQQYVICTHGDGIKWMAPPKKKKEPYRSGTHL